MYRILLAGSALALGLLGCTTGIVSGDSSPSRAFSAPVSAQAAYKAALEQANMCLRGADGGYRVVGNFNEAAGSGQVRVVAPVFDGEVAQVDVNGTGAATSDIKVTMWGRGIWNAAASDAMHDAIIFGVPSCTVYMPKDPPATAKPAVQPSRR